VETFRITSREYADLSGEGGMYASGRWHTQGHPIVYTAGSRSLAILEKLVHTNPAELPDDQVLITVAFPDALSSEAISLDAVPATWTTPLDPACMALGDAWLQRMNAPVLRVPSAVVPEESNYLINPLHPEAGRITIRASRPFQFDERLVDPGKR
jgi:RES domain-containing protein